MSVRFEHKAGGISSGLFLSPTVSKMHGSGGLFANRSHTFKEGNEVI
jgi:hypothetical protein